MFNINEALKIYFATVPQACRDIKWITLWDNRLTLAENTRKCGIPSQPAASNFCRKYDLSFREGYHRKFRSSKESLEKLIKNGLTQAEIGRLLGVSPQRIRQLLKGE